MILTVRSTIPINNRRELGGFGGGERERKLSAFRCILFCFSNFVSWFCVSLDFLFFFSVWESVFAVSVFGFGVEMKMKMKIIKIEKVKALVATFQSQDVDIKQSIFGCQK